MDRNWIPAAACAAALLVLGIFVLSRLQDKPQALEHRPGAETTVVSQPPSTVPAQSAATAPSATKSQVPGMNYEEYMELTPGEQQAYFLSFPSYVEFMQWFNAAKKAYKDSQNLIEIEGDGEIDIGDIIEGLN